MFHKPVYKCEIMTVCNDYYIVNSNADNRLNIPLYFSVKDSGFVDTKKISSVYLLNEDGTEKIPSSILSVAYLKEIKSNTETFYQYDLELVIDLVVEDVIIYDKIYLSIDYEAGQNLKIYIGSMCLYNYKFNDEVYYTNLKGIIKQYEKTQMLVGIIVKLNTLTDLEIMEMKVLDNHIKVDFDRCKVIENINEFSNNLDSLIDEDYQIIGSTVENGNIILPNDNYLLIPLKYEEYVEKNTLGFVIKYLNEGKIYEKVINPFVFYKTNNNNKQVVKVSYEIDFN